MDPHSGEDTMSVASNDAFEDSRENFGMATFGDDSSDAPTIAETTRLPAVFGNEIIPRLDRLIQLMEALLNRPIDGSPNAVVPMVVPRNANRITGRIKNEKRAARRRNQSIKAKTRASFFRRNGTKDLKSHGQSTREKYNAAQRNQAGRNFTPCWPKTEDPYEEDDSYRVCAVYENKCAAMSW